MSASMFVTVLAVKASVEAPQPGKSILTLATPREARASAMAVKPPFSSLLPPCPWAMTTRGGAPVFSGRVRTAGTETPLEGTFRVIALKA